MIKSDEARKEIILDVFKKRIDVFIKETTYSYNRAINNPSLDSLRSLNYHMYATAQKLFEHSDIINEEVFGKKGRNYVSQRTKRLSDKASLEEDKEFILEVLSKLKKHPTYSRCYSVAVQLKIAQEKYYDLIKIKYRIN